MNNGQWNGMQVNAESRAMAWYNVHYDNAAYTKATTGFSNANGARRANRLIDDALALCGSPYVSFSRTHWGAAALEFLARFA